MPKPHLSLHPSTAWEALSWGERKRSRLRDCQGKLSTSLPLGCKDQQPFRVQRRQNLNSILDGVASGSLSFLADVSGGGSGGMP